MRHWLAALVVLLALVAMPTRPTVAQQFYGPGSAFSVVQTTTLTGSQSITLNASARVLRCNNATTLTILGLSAGSDGQRLTVLAVGAGMVDLSPQDAGATAADRLLNLVTVGKTPLAPGVGLATYVYDGTTLRWRLVEHNQGAPLLQPWVNTDYTAAAGTWTVEAADFSTYYFFLQGKQLTVSGTIGTSSVSTPTTQLYALIPHGFQANTMFQTRGGIITNDPGTGGWGSGFVDPSFITLGFYKTQYGGATTWNASTNTTYVYFTVTFPLV